MTMINLDIQSVESHGVKELYIAVTPSVSVSSEVLIREVFIAVSDILKTNQASILQERIFASTDDAMKRACAARKTAYGELDDGVLPSLLICQNGLIDPFAGIQVHAVTHNTSPKIVYDQGVGVGRVIDLPNGQFLTLSGLSCPNLMNPNEQALGMLHRAERILRCIGADFKTVARTWMWLNDILTWYDEFNQIRNAFFAKQGILTSGIENHMPASTGVGLRPANGAFCSMDLAAILTPPASIQCIHTSDKQQSAFEYGSAFSRATRALSPSSEVVYISGTAAIDEKGATTHLNNPEGQIKDTIENIRAVMKQMDCIDNQVVQAVAYCKDTQVKQIFNQIKHKLKWPWITVICDICRDNLLFEAEVTIQSNMTQKSCSA